MTGVQTCALPIFNYHIAVVVLPSTFTCTLTIYEMKEASLGSIVLGVGSGAAMFGDADASHILTGDYDI